MDIDYSFTRPIPPDDLLPLFAENVWTKDRTRADLQLMLEKSVWVGAWRGNQLVGFSEHDQHCLHIWKGLKWAH